MTAHTGNVLVAEARDALETDRNVHVLIAGLPQWLKVDVMDGLNSDVGSIQATLLDDGSRIVFRKDALTAVRVTDKRPATIEFVG